MTPLLAIALAMAPVPAGTAASPDTMALIELAIERNRLVQAQEMIRLARQDKAATDSVRLDTAAARLALIEGRNGDAFAGFSSVLRRHPRHCIALEGAGLAALHLERINAARIRLAAATAICPDRWRAWNGLGIIADKQGQWTESAAAYGRARALAPNQTAIINNLGFSLILQKRFAEAETLLREGLRIASGDARLANNLDIALIGANKALPPDRSNDTAERRASRLNNAGYTAYLLGRKDEAKAYFEQALQVSQSHFVRAATNLDIMQKAEKAQ